MGCIYFETVLKDFIKTQIFFPLLYKALWPRFNSCYSILFSKLKQKKNTLLLVELLAVTWVPCILRHPILAVTWVPCILRPYISSHLGPMYVETPYISSHLGPMYVETPYISSHLGPMYIETPYISSHQGPMYIETPYNFWAFAFNEEMVPAWLKCMQSVLSAFT